MYKVLIVDDELLIRQGMRNMIHWEELGMEIVRDVDSGEKAFAYLCEKSVDILITDIRMEGMDGLTLIQKAKEKYPHIHCIILSGYDDFEYTKKAIRLGIENYILKPVDEYELLDTLCSIAQKLSQEEKGENSIDCEKQVIEQSVLTRWLSGNIGESALRHRSVYLGIPMDGSYIQACVLRILNAVDGEKKQKIGMALERVWQPITDVRMCVCWDINRDVVIVFSGELIHQTQKVHEQVQELVRYNGWAKGAKLFAAFGTIREDYMKLAESFQEARMVAELSLVLPEASVVDYQKQYLDEYDKNVPRIDYEKLEMKIRSGRKEEITALWTQWEKAMFHMMTEPRQIRGYAAEVMCRLIILWTDTFVAEQPHWVEQKKMEELFEACTVDQLKKVLLDFSLELAQRMKKNNSDMNPSVRRVMEEVERHYDQELTLKGFAEQFHVNPVYLGRLFREATGEVFTAYLNNVRMREARRLLVETDKSVASIAVSVGYQSQGYFTNMFKKSMGCFPKEYRLRNR